MDRSFIDRLAAGAPDPERVRTALARLAQAWPVDFPPLEALLAHFPAGPSAVPDLLAVSPASAEKIIRDPAALLWLSQPEICSSERGPRRMERHLGQLRNADFGMRNSRNPTAPGTANLPIGSPSARPSPFDPNFPALRRVKNREMLRIALRDVARLSTLEQTTREITCAAELCLRTVCDGWLAELTRRWGRPGTGFCVLGMGKLGGGELNYSSDIDVIFLYGEDGSLNPGFTWHEFFTRLAEKITATFAAASPDGPLFRIDLRLRPEGGSGPLARSLESCENYYAGFGETWERMALIKARGVAGSEELAYEFAHRLQPFVYPRSLSTDALDEIAAIKRRIEREILDEAGLERNVKLGRGGIREIEFVTQALQLLHGARHAFLQERNTLRALQALRRLEFVEPGDMAALTAAYGFLRDIEHRLQIEQEKQTHTLPQPGPARALLARSLGFADATAFDAALLTHTTAVRRIFDKFLQGSGELAAPSAPDLAFFHDPASAEKELRELGAPGTVGHVSPRTRKLYATLEPLLLAGLRPLADPDQALRGFLRFVERYGIRGLLFESLVANPRLLDLLLRLFDSSRFLTEIVLRRPQLIEETTRTGSLGRELDTAAHLAGLARQEEDLAPGDWVRVYRRAQILRIALRDILGFAEIGQVQWEYTALAEACVRHVQRSLGLDETLTIVALGKFGGAELSYGCDLDVVFIGDDPARAADLMKAMTAQTSEGIVFPVDARLRPEGESGLLAVPIETYRRYFQTRAQLWEAQALTRARPICGPAQAAFMEWARQAWAAFARREDVLPGIRRMHQRVLRERGGGDPLAFKTGAGGLMELEFHTQALQMRHGIWEPNTVRALASLAAAGFIAPDAAGARGDDYIFLRRCEAAVRRVDNSSLSNLPAEPAGQRQVAIRMGFAGPEEFLRRYQAAREGIHRWCSALE